MAHPPAGAPGTRSELFETLAENLPATVYLSHNDEHYTKLYLNSAVEALTGYPTDDFLWGRVSFADLHHPEDVETIRRTIDEAIAADRPFRLEYRLRHADGSYRWVEEFGQGIRNVDGKLAYLEGALFDITERRIEEAARRMAEEKYAVAFRSSPDALVITTLDEGRFVEVNDGFERITGYGRDEAIGRTTTELGIWPTADDRAEFFRLLREKGSVRDLACRLFTRTGRDIYCQISAEVVEIDGERCALSMVKDVTQQHRAREILQRTEERFSKAFVANPNPAVITRRSNGTILEVNEVLCEMSGRRRDELVGKNGTELGLWDEEHARELNRRLDRNGSARGLELRARGREGKFYDLLVSAVVVEMDGEPCVLNVGVDITERKRLETQLFRAQRLESIGTLAGGIAHDLNNVLTPILLAIKLLRRDRPKQRERVLSILETNARRGADLIRQLLTFARGAEGKRIQVELGSLVREVGVIARDTFPKTIELSVEVDDDLWQVEGDPTQIHQVLLNLAVNARDAMDGKGRLRISATNRTFDREGLRGRPGLTPGRYVVLEVADSGPGIPRELREQVFDPFFTTKDPAHGTGLGLFTVETIAAAHGGFVDVGDGSDDGERAGGDRGARLRVVLPVTPRHDREADRHSVLPPLDGRGELVLLVDDEEAVREIAAGVLEASGYRTVLAADGHAALARFEERRNEVRVAVVDLMMPHMGGLEAIHALRALDPELPIIAMSGVEQPGDGQGEGVTPAEANLFLPKPLTAEELLDALRTALRPAAAVAQSTGPTSSIGSTGSTGSTGPVGPVGSGTRRPQ